MENNKDNEMTEKEKKDFLRGMTKRHIEQSFEMMESMGMPLDYALAIFADTTRFLERDNSPEFEKFLEYSGQIFENEFHVKCSYHHAENVPPYEFRPASVEYTNILFQLYEQYSNQEYESEQELTDIMKNILSGKKILEIGCGPGFFLPILKRLGAQAHGIEVCEDNKDKVPDVDIVYTDAENLESILGEEKFDIIISKDVFCGVVLKKDKAYSILENAYNKLKKNGIIINQIDYKRMELSFYFMRQKMICNDLNYDFDRMLDNWFYEMSEEEQEEMLHVNSPSLTEDEIKKIGYEVMRKENDENLTTIMKKQTNKKLDQNLEDFLIKNSFDEVNHCFLQFSSHLDIDKILEEYDENGKYDVYFDNIHEIGSFVFDCRRNLCEFYFKDDMKSKIFLYQFHEKDMGYHLIGINIGDKDKLNDFVKDFVDIIKPKLKLSSEHNQEIAKHSFEFAASQYRLSKCLFNSFPDERFRILSYSNILNCAQVY